jgi:hypothetical protein
MIGTTPCRARMPATDPITVLAERLPSLEKLGRASPLTRSKRVERRPAPRSAIITFPAAPMCEMKIWANRLTSADDSEHLAALIAVNAASGTYSLEVSRTIEYVVVLMSGGH